MPNTSALHKILCAVDFSPQASKAMHVAAELARLANVPLVLAYVWEFPSELAAAHMPVDGAAVQEQLDSENRLLHAWAETARELGAPEVTTEIPSGIAWEGIVRLAKQDTAIDLVVVGTHGRTGLRHALIGSVAEKVLRHAPCPVLVTRDSDDHPHEVKRGR